jgi:hypothetical protein
MVAVAVGGGGDLHAVGRPRRRMSLAGLSVSRVWRQTPGTRTRRGSGEVLIGPGFFGGVGRHSEQERVARAGAALSGAGCCVSTKASAVRARSSARAHLPFVLREPARCWTRSAAVRAKEQRIGASAHKVRRDGDLETALSRRRLAERERLRAVGKVNRPMLLRMARATGSELCIPSRRHNHARGGR